MRTGVAAYDVAAASQLAYLLRIEEAGSSNPVCGNKEMTPPAVLLKFVGHICVCAEFTIVECQEYRNFIMPSAKTINRAHRDLWRPLLDGHDMIVKLLVVKLIESFVPREDAIRPVCHIVVSERDGFHREIAAARPSCRTDA